MSAPARVAVVTGAARGIGHATAMALGKNGFAVTRVDVRAPELRETAALVREAGTEALALEGDVTSFAAAQRLADDVLAAWGRVDVLVNNAGISQPRGCSRSPRTSRIAPSTRTSRARSTGARRWRRRCWRSAPGAS